MNKAIGGYQELELRSGEHYHHKALHLNTGRNCLEYVIRARGYKKVYVPYYTCNVIYEALNKCNVEVENYHIGAGLCPANDFPLANDAAILITNYYGLVDEGVKQMAKVYGNHLIVDNAQAFFAKPIPGVDTFYSARKFFGVPDGAYLYTDKHLGIELEQDQSWHRMRHLLLRADLSAEDGFKAYQAAEEALQNQPIKRMSQLTDKLLSSIDYKTISVRRRDNFMILHEALREKNIWKFELPADATPLAYPLLTTDTGLRKRLIEKRIYVPTYWPNMYKASELNEVEHQLQSMLPLPVSQSYNAEDMQHIIDIIKNHD